MSSELTAAEGGLRFANPPYSGFVAGTLVHARERLVPIEEIKVGDWVLSQPENKGGKVYKRVSATHVHEHQEVYLFSIGRVDENWEVVDEDAVCVTGEHPFWQSDIASWEPARALGESCKVEVRDGSAMDVFDCREIWQRARPEEGTGYAVAVGAEGDASIGCHRIDFRGRQPEVSPDGEFYLLDREYRDGEWLDLEYPTDDQDYPRYRARVYNITVEDFHTYYTGRLGIWVHDKHE